jgi:hypothetical protein
MKIDGQRQCPAVNQRALLTPRKQIWTRSALR